MTTSNSSENDFRKRIGYALIVAAVLLLVLMVFFFWQVRSLRHNQSLHMREFRLSHLLEGRTPLPVSETGIIRAWMTFEYVNRIFALPPEHLRTTLAITDARYPRLTLADYAKEEKVDQAVFLTKVADAVRSYLTPTSSTSTPRP
ncbi:MAG TPA: hypothetical protein VMC43_01465 [Candidatus Paceibacterota bacterium]|nr:hypothetical protein [Candidatus Paceibacterota bacterium]